MPRQRSQKVLEAKYKILNRIREGFYRPGDRFLSNRSVAKAYGISFQTAQRLITELCGEGWLQQQPSSGTFIAGSKERLRGVQIFSSPRTAQLNGVIARLLGYLTQQLDAEKIPWIHCMSNPAMDLKPDYFPVFCDCPAEVGIAARRQYALLLDDAPPAGLEASYIDSLAADDFSGGTCAAQLFLQKYVETGRYTVLSGPENEAKSQSRVAGFRSLLPQAKVISAGSWFYEDGCRAAPQVLKQASEGIFCCNDLLAKGVMDYCRDKKLRCPPMIGFDNDPIAETLNITTIEIPEQKMVTEALLIIRRRLQGDSASATRQLFSCRPVVRASLGREKSR